MLRPTLLVVLMSLASVDSGYNKPQHSTKVHAPTPSHAAKVSNLPHGFHTSTNITSVPIPAEIHAEPQPITSGRDKRDCPNCVDESQYTPNKWTMPLLKLGEKRYYLGIFFKANWFKATQYCRYHGMHLASISSQEENDRLEKHIRDFGLGHEHFWISGTDLADEGNFFWMATGRPITFTNWNAGEPNNFRYENGEEENCLELWNRDGKGLKWNDSPCSFETYFVCEVQPN
ncbi:C-type lectin 37Db isoform X2 [Drosophila kikkawai]|uniref:C-type lectin 37Db isoform X2 n=1 Tax=Drosophila kikkawai TaxID=30033 RepID=A0A6P4IFA2_DROKI|nr:C-type lectin 37Db isoform X2 [Drosophila kikkawai]